MLIMLLKKTRKQQQNFAHNNKHPAYGYLTNLLTFETQNLRKRRKKRKTQV